MTIQSEEYTLNVDECIDIQAWSTYRQYNQFVDREDLVQEGWVYVLEHENRVNGYRTHEKPKLAYYWLSRDVWEAMDRFARKQRAQRLGFEPEDEAFYGKAVLEALLPAVLKGDPIRPQGEVSEIRGNNDPAEGGTYLAMYVDVGKAWEHTKLSGRERDILRKIFGEDWTQKEVAEELGVGQPSIAKQVKRSLQKMTNYLGGQYPPDQTE